MKIYAVRDRLIGYFMQPFVGPDDKNVLASVARLINQNEVTSDIAQAPHQFEVWRLGRVEEDGTIVPDKEYLQDCSALVRRDIRPVRERGRPEVEHPLARAEEAPSGAQGGTGPNGAPVSDKAPATPTSAGEARPPAGGGYNSRARDTHEAHLSPDR